jgi:hypothetical protein
MNIDTGMKVYDETDVKSSCEVKVKDAGKFIEEMLGLFVNRGTLYISSYDFGYWANELSAFRSNDAVKLETSLPDPAYLSNGFAITEDFVYVFKMNCLKNIDPRSMFNQFLIYDKGAPLLQCACNFEDVYLNVELPQEVMVKLREDGSIG